MDGIATQCHYLFKGAMFYFSIFPTNLLRYNDDRRLKDFAAHML